MYLQKEHLWIRNASEADARQLAEWWNDGKIMAHAGFLHGIGTNEDEVKQQLADGPSVRLIIGDGEVCIGEMSYRNVGEKTAEIGIKICRFDYQNQGRGTIYLQMLLAWLEQNGFEKVILDTDLTNHRAMHVYEKIGFIKVGVRENCFKDEDGHLHSYVDYVYHFK